MMGQVGAHTPARRRADKSPDWRVGADQPLWGNLDLLADYLKGLNRVLRGAPSLPPSARDVLTVLPDWADFVSGMASRARLKWEEIP